MADLNPRPLPGRFPVPRATFMRLLRADFDWLDRHGNPLSASRFWELADAAPEEG